MFFDKIQGLSRIKMNEGEFQGLSRPCKRALKLKGFQDAYKPCKHEKCVAMLS